MQNLEKELQEKDEKAQSEINDLQQQSETALQQLKNFYEMEKEKMEKKA